MQNVALAVGGVVLVLVVIGIFVYLTLNSPGVL
jgi:hypothetical protein